MTEVEWDDCGNPMSMLRFLRGDFGGGEVHARKVRLFLCACSRRLLRDNPHPRIQRAVETAERFSDGLASDEEMEQVYFDLRADLPEYTNSRGLLPAFRLAEAASSRNAVARLEARMDWLVREGAFGASAAGDRASADVLRDLFGPLPFRSLKLARAMLGWEHGTVRALAQGIYDEGRWGEMPVLADALEDAGCREEEFLRHSRCAQAHYKGCWVVDALLEKR